MLMATERRRTKAERRRARKQRRLERQAVVPPDYVSPKIPHPDSDNPFFDEFLSPEQMRRRRRMLSGQDEHLALEALHVNYYDIQACGWNPMNPEIWEWWRGLMSECRWKLMLDSRRLQ